MIHEQDLWRSDDPVFSVRVRRSDRLVIVADPEIRPPGWSLPAFTALSTAAWAALLFVWLPDGFLPTSGFSPATLGWSEQGWWMPVIIVLVLLMVAGVWALGDRGRRLFREGTIGFRSCVLAAGSGLAIAAAAHVNGAVPADEPGVAPWMLALGGLAVAAASAALLPGRIRRIRSRAALIVRLETSGARHRGSVVSVGARSGTELGRPRFRTVRIAFTDDTGAHELLAAMATPATRVPLPGSPVLVLTGAPGEAHVIVDPDRPMTFDPDADRYREANDGGGS